jgi:hypothetical protein
MKLADDSKGVKQKTYNVDILASFELQLSHQFSDIGNQSSGESVKETFDDFILEIEDNFSSNFINIHFESAKKIRKDDLYKFTGSIERCYEFSEQDVDLLEGELIDGVFDNQLHDMKLAVETACDQSGYELYVINFNWADDEIVDEG